MTTSLEKIVKEACKVQAELNAVQSDIRMNAGDIVKKCLELGESNPERLTSLRWLLDSKADSLRSCIAFVRGVVRAFSEGRINSGAPSNLARMCLPGRDEARAELAELRNGHNLYELWALGCQQAAIKYPDQFGAITDAGAHQERIAELKAKRSDLLERIPHAWGAEDILLSGLNREGKALITLQIAPTVSVGPLDSLGERLVAHLMESDPQKWGSAPEAKPVAGRGVLKNSGVAAPL